MKHKIAIKWVYAAKDEQDGARVLVDRILPHGRDLHDLGVDTWYQQAAPSTGLKRQLTKGLLDWKNFTHSYREELHQQPKKLLALLELTEKGNLTLLTAEREPEQTWLPLLKDLLEARLKNIVTSRSSH
ncbi:MAG TPA: DUF488 family protein [Marinospirillum sp.]|uniref:DUF488 domain-containing protein n=1 Tax=Marinospirillum sp. TaxID=2183934 RepID=UPI002B461229|nr:DUF488 family protein [Marinospirillum sp.]HKM15271.1 DUF488 family protein [Marinospirillum sp.]